MRAKISDRFRWEKAKRTAYKTAAAPFVIRFQYQGTENLAAEQGLGNAVSGIAKTVEDVRIAVQIAEKREAGNSFVQSPVYPPPTIQTSRVIEVFSCGAFGRPSICKVVLRGQDAVTISGLLHAPLDWLRSSRPRLLSDLKSD